MRAALIALMSAFALCASASASQPDDDEVTPHGRTLTKFRYYSGTPAVHPARRLRWYYNPTNEAPALAGRMQAILRSAASMWSRRCGIQFEYGGTTTQPAGAYDLDNVFGWGSTMAGALAMAWVRSENGTRIDDADIIFNPSLVQNESTAFNTAVHEIGHALGLAHSNKERTVMSGPPYSSYTQSGEPTLDDYEGCQALYNNPYCPTAKPADEQRIEAGGCPTGMDGGLRFRRSYYCSEGSWAANAWEREERVCTARASTAAAPTGTLREYVREATGEYFITSLTSEQNALDNGLLSGWVRTGVSWPVWESVAPELVPVCRFYGDASIDPQTGKRKGPDSHFHTADAEECSKVPLTFPVWKLETSSAFRVVKPTGGQCPAGTRSVTRFFRPVGDATHRYVSDGAAAALMLARGWVAEGVVFCLPG